MVTNNIKMETGGLIVLCMIMLLSVFAGCTSTTDPTNQSSSGTVLDGPNESGGTESTGSSEYLESQQVMRLITNPQDVLDTIDDSQETEITFNSGTVSAEGLDVNGSVVYITESGTYVISGTSNEGRLVVDLQEKGSVNLVLDGLDLTSSVDSPIVIHEATATVITLAEGSENSIADLSSLDGDENATNSAIYSKDDLYINGQGALTVDSENKNGIQSKDQLVVIEGNITVDAAKEAIKAKDYVLIGGGTLSLTSGEDGISATEDDPEKGFVAITGGNIDVTAAQDGIQAENYVIIEGGELNIKTTGDGNSSKGMKGGIYVAIKDAEINVDSVDDSIHSDNNILINGGSIVLSSGDDGVHADAKLTINGGSVFIKKSYEGLESKNIIITGGNISLNSSDDGINIADGSSGGFQGGPMAAISGAMLKISGGYIYMNSNGDGLDSNGDFYMDGGTVIVDGPLRNDNGGIDVNGECLVDGGFLAVAGSIGMAESPDQSSSQNAVSIGFSSQLPSGTVVHIESEDGKEIITYVPSKAFQSFVFSSDSLVTGEAYNIYTGGTATGSSTNGLYDSVSEKGTLYDSFTVSNTVTSIGTSMGMGGQDPHFGGMGGGRPFR